MTAEQFKAMCDTAMRMQSDPGSAIESCTITDTTINVFGWRFGISDLNKSAKEILDGWDVSYDEHFGITDIIYRKDEFQITLESM